MVRRWHADPFGFLRPWNEVAALFGSAPPATPPSTGTGVVTFLMGGSVEWALVFSLTSRFVFRAAWERRHGQRWSADPLGMLWPEMGAAVVMSLVPEELIGWRVQLIADVRSPVAWARQSKPRSSKANWIW
jgi:hypothetical protein